MSAPKTVRLMKVLEIANKSLDGKASPAELLEEIDDQMESFEGWKKKYINIPMHKSLKEEFQPQLDKAIEGIELFLDSLEMIKNVLEEESEEGEEGEEGEEESVELENGKLFELSEENQNIVMDAMEKAKEGNESLNECYEMSQESVRKTREESIMYEDDSSIL